MKAAAVVRLFTVNQGAQGQGKIGCVQQNRQAVLSFKDTAKADMGNEKIPNASDVGKPKRALLNHFGSACGVKGAGLVDPEAAPGISCEIARRVDAHFHPGVRLEG
jgi:excinuclease ABC subunit C